MKLEDNPSLEEKLINAKGNTERWTDKMKLTVDFNYFAYHHIRGSKIYRDDVKIFLSYRQNWC
jgi:hypothetical protein